MRWDIKIAVLLFLASIFAAVAVMVAPDVLHLSEAEKLALFWFGFGGAGILMIAAIIIALKGEAEEERKGRKPRMLSLVGMIICAIGLICFSIAYFWPSQKKEAATPVIASTAVPRDPDALYQYGEAVATVVGANFQ